jgi:hypothetical protein
MRLGSRAGKANDPDDYPIRPVPLRPVPPLRSLWRFGLRRFDSSALVSGKRVESARVDRGAARLAFVGYTKVAARLSLVATPCNKKLAMISPRPRRGIHRRLRFLSLFH